MRLIHGKIPAGVVCRFLGTCEKLCKRNHKFPEYGCSLARRLEKEDPISRPIFEKNTYGEHIEQNPEFIFINTIPTSVANRIVQDYNFYNEVHSKEIWKEFSYYIMCSTEEKAGAVALQREGYVIKMYVQHP